MQLPLETEALVVNTPGGDFEMTPIVINDLRPDEVLVEMKYSGVCHTDFWLQQGALTPLLTLPAIAGHEGAGRILAVGPGVRDKTLAPGDPVLLSFTACGACGECTHTDQGGPNFSRCAAFAPLNLSGARRADGSSPATLAADGRPVAAQFFGHSSFARVSAVHELCVVRCPREQDLALYAPMGCGYQTGAGTVLNVLKPGRDHTVVVFGAGSVGSAAIMAAASVPVKQLIAVDVVEKKLDLAREVGATDVLDSSKCAAGGAGVVEEIKKLTGGRGVDFAIDTTGVSAVVEQMLDCLAYGGTAASVGVPPREDKITVGSGAFFSGRKTWVAVAEGDSHPPKFIPRLIELHKQGKFPVEKISKVYPVAELKQAIADMKDGTTVKAIIEF